MYSVQGFHVIRELVKLNADFCRTGVKERVSVPVYIGSGITAQNLHHCKAG